MDKVIIPQFAMFSLGEQYLAALGIGGCNDGEMIYEAVYENNLYVINLTTKANGYRVEADGRIIAWRDDEDNELEDIEFELVAE